MTDENTMTAELGNILLVIVVIGGFVVWYVRNRGELRKQMLRVPLPRGKKENDAPVDDGDAQEPTKKRAERVNGFLVERPVTLAYVVLNMVFASLSMLAYTPKIFPNFAGRFMADGATAIVTIVGVLFLVGGLQFHKGFRDPVSVINFILWVLLLIVSTLSNVPPSP